MFQVEKFDFHNPLENTASILKGLAHEIQELRDGLASEHRLSEIDMEFGGRLDRLETKMNAEIEDRLHACQDIVKKINADGSQWKGRCSNNEKDITDLKQALENTCMQLSQRHDQCKADVDKIAGMLRESALAKDTFEQFVGRPSTPRRPQTPTTASPGSRSYTPTRMSPLHLSSPSHAFAPSSLCDGDSKTSSRMRVRLSGLR